MTRRGTVSILLAATVLLLVAATAIAARYTGEGRDDRRVGVSFVKDGRVIKRFTIERARFFCTDGDRFRAGTRVGRMRLTRRDRFRGRFTARNGSTSVLVRGRLFGTKARGRLRMVTFFREVQCNSNRVRWKARRVRRD